LNLIPKIVSVGVGCRKGTDFNDVYTSIKEVLERNNISHFAINSINSIDLKKEEEAIKKTAEVFKVPFHTYSMDELNKIQGKFSNSDFVKKIAGVDTVCERAAIMGSKSKRLIISKAVVNSVTVAAAIDDYEVKFNSRQGDVSPVFFGGEEWKILNL
jgi:cobalt-precorrin 5A hydrolase